ncbi:MAG: DinB family protein [Planctomycetes bacterium]|nr:DinB family protein [Planctomycetota bacterium]
MSTNPGVARFQRQLAAETWADSLVLDSLLSVPEPARGSVAYDRAVRLLPHNVLARHIWLRRLNGEAHEAPKDWFPAWSIDETREKCKQADAVWSSYLAGLTDADLARECRYQNSEGKQFSSLVEDILIHVFNHSTYHRGQIARLVTECGGHRAGTDYIGHTRRTL